MAGPANSQSQAPLVRAPLDAGVAGRPFELALLLMDARDASGQYPAVAKAADAETSTAPLLRVGIDENGLGPRLGPLIVTAVHARTEGSGHRLVGRAPHGELAKRLGDSKALIRFGDTALGEAWARAVLALTHGCRFES